MWCTHCGKLTLFSSICWKNNLCFSCDRHQWPLRNGVTFQHHLWHFRGCGMCDREDLTGFNRNKYENCCQKHPRLWCLVWAGHGVFLGGTSNLFWSPVNKLWVDWTGLIYINQFCIKWNQTVVSLQDMEQTVVGVDDIKGGFVSRCLCEDGRPCSRSISHAHLCDREEFQR